MKTLIDHAAFIASAIAVIALLYLSYRAFGWRGVAGAFGAVALLVIYRKGRDDGSTTIIEKGQADADHAIREAAAARRAADRRDADPGKLREDDGFKRPSA